MKTNIKRTEKRKEERGKMKSIRKVSIIIIMSAVFALTGCGGSIGGGDGVGRSSETIVIAGSTSVQPLSEELAEEFMKENQDTDIEIQGGGSGQGIKAIQSGIADLGALSRELTDEEKASTSEVYVIANDGVAIIVNTNTKVDNLTLEQLKKIFTGEVTDWSQVGGESQPIVVVSREAGSGTRSAFTEITGVASKDANGDEKDNTLKSAIIQGSTGAVAQTVSGTVGSIGYVSLGSLDDSVKTLKVEGIEISEEAVSNGTYPISRPFLYVSASKPSPAVQRWIDFVLSDEGQKIVAESGFVTVAR
jgi:phosphate transport system substrate-binding protein